MNCIPKVYQKYTKSIPKVYQNYTNKKNDKKTENDNRLYQCKYCEKTYKSDKSMYRHINEMRCKKIPEREIKMIKVFRNNKVLNKKIEK